MMHVVLSQFLFQTALRKLRGVYDVSADIAEMKVRPIHLCSMLIHQESYVFMFWLFPCCNGFEMTVDDRFAKKETYYTLPVRQVPKLVLTFL